MPGASALGKRTPAARPDDARYVDLPSARATYRGILPGPVVGSHTTNARGIRTDAGMFSRIPVYFYKGVHEVRMVFGNYYLGSGDVIGPNLITVRCSIEYPAQTWYPGHFPNEDATRSVTIQPGVFATTDPIPVDIPDGTWAWVNVLVAPSSGGSYPVGSGAIYGNGSGQGEYCLAPTTTDYTTSAPTGVGNITGDWYGPLAVCGETNAPRTQCVAIQGDSIISGSGDVVASPITNTSETGWARRALNNAVPYTMSGRSSSQASHFQGLGRRFTMLFATRATSAWECWGINDLANGRTLAQLQVDKINLWMADKNRGSRVWTVTLTPRTTSTDSWATTANQTKPAYEASRLTYNGWVRDGAPILNGAAVAAGSSATGTVRAGQAGHPLVGYIEVADQCETARDSGLWQVNGSANYATSDGIHPSATFHAAIAAVVPASAKV